LCGRASRRIRIGSGSGIALGAVQDGLANLVVIGAQKCGTTALNRYLDLHPEIAMSRGRELNFFLEQRNWSRGLDWYRAQFEQGTPVRGDQSPNYSAYPLDLGVPERMHRTIPDAKLIYMVRDPLQRIGAHWVHDYAKHREHGGVSETIMHPFTTYLVRSHYFMQLQRFLKYYPPDRVLVIEQGDLLKERLPTLRRIFEFAGVDPGFQDPGFETLDHRTSRKRRWSRAEAELRRMKERDDTAGRVAERAFGPAAIGFAAWRRVQRPIERPDIRGALSDEALEALREDAERLRDFTGRSFDHWSIWN
jgi:Sulfotransferase domain